MTIDDNDLPIEMGKFFNSVADIYDTPARPMTPYDLALLFESVAGAIKETDDEPRILDLGAGTGAELEWVLARAPNAQVTCIDMSIRMLDELRRKHASSLGHIQLITGSFLDTPFKDQYYHYVVSVQSLHHLTFSRRIDLYRKIRNALVPGGKYIEGDWVVSEKEETEYLLEYQEQIEVGVLDPEGMYHVDIPFSVPTIKRALSKAGFPQVEVLHEEDYAAVLSAC